MPFDKKAYKVYKQFMDERLSHPPFQYTGKCPVDWARVFIPLMADCQQREDYEGAKAIKDAIRGFLNKYLSPHHKIKESDTIGLKHGNKATYP